MIGTAGLFIPELLSVSLCCYFISAINAVIKVSGTPLQVHWLVLPDHKGPMML